MTDQRLGFLCSAGNGDAKGLEESVEQVHFLSVELAGAVVPVGSAAVVEEVAFEEHFEIHRMGFEKLEVFEVPFEFGMVKEVSNETDIHAFDTHLGVGEDVFGGVTTGVEGGSFDDTAVEV